MLNISFLTHKEIIQSQTEKNRESFIEKFLTDIGDGEKNYYNFTKIILKKLPENLLSHISENDLINFTKELYRHLNDRKKKKYHLSSFSGITEDFFIGNFSIITITTDDRPFLVDSLREFFYEINLNQQFIIHPIFSIKRNNKGEIIELGNPYIGSSNESFVMIFLSNITGEELEVIKAEIEEIYENIIVVVDDYPKMIGFLKQLGQHYQGINSETSDFIHWLADDKFIIQGIRVISNIKSFKEYDLEQMGVYKFNRTTGIIPHLIEAIHKGKMVFLENYPIIVDKALYRSKVKKRRNYDRIILVDKSDGNYTIISIIGVFTKDALKSSPLEISIVKNKIKKVVEYFNFVNGSHDHKWLLDILESFPKIEIFNFDEKTLIEVLNTIFSIQGKSQVRLFYKNLPPQNLYLFLAIPTEKYSSELVMDLKKAFETYLNANSIDISIRHDDHGYEFIIFNFFLNNPEISTNDNAIKNIVLDLLKDWDEKFYEILNEEYVGYEADKVYDTYAHTFGENYKVKCSPKEASDDIKNITQLNKKHIISTLYKENKKLVVKIFRKDRMLLTDIMPIIDNIGLKVNEEDIFELKHHSEKIYLHNIYLDCIENSEIFYESYKNFLPELIENIIKDHVENDRLNKLLITAGLTFKEVDLLRALRNYLEQINPNFKRSTIEDSLLNNPHISKLFINYFKEKFDPLLSKRHHPEILNEIYQNIDAIKSVTEDRILRCFADILQTMVRTNYFQKPHKHYISFKISSKKLSILPDPKPLYEIYVHSANMEGIHLRGGKVARGGLRFSDRHDDFRTEILGLMKTQMVKNTVIVPVGSKGGFIVKKRYEDRDEDKLHVIEQYKTFIRGLLDITDNYTGKKVVHPQNVVIYDENDPYLVVAADKGTATFSDIANSVSIEYGFWLGDAFASGGSAGYDHKKVGITAKGAWECVKRHFRELGKDIQKEPFTVIGIGDMSGDVFGNGMLLSKQIKLVAAFNHAHIFLDPSPDTTTSYKERLRLFKLPRSSWTDYNRDLISKGGGIFERNAKKIDLSQEIKELLKTTKDTVSGEELIKLILKADVELLWNGGIGTYIKDSTETNLEVGDKANDNVRVDAEELNVKVIGEGGNLGLTQKARIKFSALGGKINTDAVDNSAGVDMSDHEVNIKILLSSLMKKKLIKDLKERNKLIADLTDDVTELVLKDNFEQSRILSIEELNAKENLLPYIEAANHLKEIGLLKFEIEKIDFIKEKRMITRPELAVLMAYTKLFLFDNIVEHVDINDPILRKLYESYYPNSIIQKYREEIYEHKLIKEIIATVLVNRYINQNGMVTYLQLHNRYGKDLYKIMMRYFFAEEILAITPLREKLNIIDTKYSSDILYKGFIEIEKTLNVATEWLLNDSNYELLKNNIESFNTMLKCLGVPSQLELKKQIKEFEKEFHSEHLPSTLVGELAKIKFSKSVFDLFELYIKDHLDPEIMIKNYFYIAEELHLKTLSIHIKAIKPHDQWDNVNKDNLLKRIKLMQKKFTQKITQNPLWFKNVIKNEKNFFTNYFGFLESIEKNESLSLVPFNVIIDSLDKILEI
ncbi:MAG: NAD-glutamate dehydrogenase [Calditerrivibrio sp.]|nr:NAD-glutamate dehydrogenase [Calditerrivibrio sp.]